MLEEGIDLVDVGVDRHLVLPLKLRPHVAELDIGARRRADVVHDVNVDVVEHDDVAISVASTLKNEVAKDDSCLRGRHLDVGTDDTRLARRECVDLWALNQLEVAHRRELKAHALQRLGRPVDNGDIHHDVVLVHCHVRLSVHGVAEACELQHAVEAPHARRLLVDAHGTVQVTRDLVLNLNLAQALLHLELHKVDEIVRLARGA
mmetsp:Transcript_7477/g.22651  ORF Transcript_7477/g.22651 Transcript_7477/m.22651 type:complete len:205 (+) Transcript_7477:479-1093(+)